MILIDDFLALMIKKNQGIALGKLANLPELYQIYLRSFILLILSLMFGYLMIFSNSMRFLSRTALILMIAGGVSNQIDRFWHDGVIDMLEVSIFGVNLFTCNLADIYISLGFVLYLFASYFRREKKLDTKSNDRQQNIDRMKRNSGQPSEAKSTCNREVASRTLQSSETANEKIIKTENKEDNEQEKSHLIEKKEEEVDYDEMD